MTKTGQAKTKTKIKTTFSRPRPLFLKTIKLLTQDHKKRFLIEKIRPMMPVMSVLPSHAGIMPVTEKTCLLPTF